MKQALTIKQRVFVGEYLIDFNATAAARRSGYSEKSAARIAIELLNKTHVSTDYVCQLKSIQPQAFY